MNQNQEMTALLHRMLEVFGSAIASTARVLAHGADTTIPTPPGKPVLKNLDLLIMDLGLMQAVIAAFVSHMAQRRKTQ